MDARAQVFTDLLLEVFRVNGLLLAAGDDLTRPVGLTSARWQVLGVAEHGPVPVSHVARTMGLSRQSVQITANGLGARRFYHLCREPASPPRQAYARDREGGAGARLRPGAAGVMG